MSNRRVALFSLLSLLLHLLIGIGATYFEVEPPAAQPFVLELEAPSEQEKQDARRIRERGAKQVVRQAELPDQLKKSKVDKPARFLSERDQTVLQETRAAATGLTQNRSSDSASARPGIPGLNADSGRDEPPPKSEKPGKLASSEPKPKSTLRGAADLELGPIQNGESVGVQSQADVEADGSRPLRIPNFGRIGGLERGMSTAGEALPSDIKLGNLTALNTDRYVHYSFYARFEELFRHRWVKYVRAALFSYQNTARRPRGEKFWTTRLEIVLDSKGRFVRGILHEGSGFKMLDAAPVQAMQEVAQIPNPPTEMVKSDGTVRMMYEFNVQFLSQYASGGE